MRTRSNRRSAQKCTKCWRPAAQGHKQCDYHLNYFREYRKKRREQGLCLHCGQPSNGYQLCDDCAARSSEQMRERYYERRSNGQCVICGKGSNGYSLCDGCASRKAQTRALRAS
jgi:hypothetical protein